MAKLCDSLLWAVGCLQDRQSRSEPQVIYSIRHMFMFAPDKAGRRWQETRTSLIRSISTLSQYAQGESGLLLQVEFADFV